MGSRIMGMLLVLLMVAGCSGESAQSSGEGSRFNVTMSGAYTRELTPANATGYYNEKAFDEETIYQVWFGADSNIAAFVLLGEEPEAGRTYTISSEGWIDTVEAAATFILNDGDTPISINGDGTITFDTVGETVTGNFEFSVTKPDDPSYQVTISATFDGI